VKRRAADIAPIVGAFLLAASAPAISIVDPGQGPVALADGAHTLPHELSGVTWVPGTSEYWAVSDDQPVLQRLSVSIDPATGTIASGTTIGSLALTAANGGALPASRDLEGIALSADGASVFVSDEGGIRIRQHSLATGRALAEIGPATNPALAVYANQRTNLGWESLARAPDTGLLYTVNEEALTVDGPNGQGATSTRVRLQALATSGASAGQWGYTVSGDIVPDTFANIYAGVSDVVALPGGKLLVLERSAGLVAYPDLDFRDRIFLVDVTGATDVTGFPTLKNGGYVPAAKTLLWEGLFPDDNFEGIALGPTLANGDRSLLLVSDDGAGFDQSLLALRLVGVPEPSTALLLGAALAGLSRRRA
jgi:hypothetical protein